MSHSLKIIFAGTPNFAARHLGALLFSEHQVIGVFTQPDRPAGRNNKLTLSPVKQLAQQYNLPILQSNSLHSVESQQLIANLQADIMVVVAYGLILPKEVLDIPRLGCINIHGSLLPRWRGAAPIQRALLAGDKETGITIIKMNAGLDTGAMLLQLTCPITATDTSATLYDKLAILGPKGLLTILSEISQGNIKPQEQDDMYATYASKLSKKEARLDWSLSAVKLERCVRAFNPWPISYFKIDEQLIKVWQAEALPHQNKSIPGEIIAADKRGIKIATVKGILNIKILQPAGKKIMSAQDFLNSRSKLFIPGTCIT